MKYFLFILLLFPISFYPQTIDGICGIKFGHPKNDFLTISWVKDSIIQQIKREYETHIFVKTVQFEGKVYDACIFNFYNEEL